MRHGRSDDGMHDPAGSHRDNGAVCDLSVSAWPGQLAAVRRLSNTPEQARAGSASPGSAGSREVDQ